MGLQSRGSAAMSAPGVSRMRVEKSDTVDLEIYPKSLWINTDGEIRGILAQDWPAEGETDEDVVDTYEVVAACALPLVFRRIYATGTTAEFVAIRV